jgi:hypothetical protein
MDTRFGAGATLRRGNRVTTKKRSTSIPRLDPRAALLVTFPFPCPNCDSPVPDATLFCTELCRDEAKFVRYYRERIADGTLWKPDVREAIQIKRAHILGGGYDAQARQVPDAIRLSVIERDGGKCPSCSREFEKRRYGPGMAPTSLAFATRTSTEVAARYVQPGVACSKQNTSIITT